MVKVKGTWVLKTFSLWLAMAGHFRRSVTEGQDLTTTQLRPNPFSHQGVTHVENSNKVAPSTRKLGSWGTCLCGCYEAPAPSPSPNKLPCSLLWTNLLHRLSQDPLCNDKPSPPSAGQYHRDTWKQEFQSTVLKMLRLQQNITHTKKQCEGEKTNINASTKMTQTYLTNISKYFSN